ncbi:nuclear transport factor 2 family protein [Hymenobacter volaticus]|uniref:Nuclear transport factor 2 family protein n=1 Tax=Hymenobacter volaticus TaxID=2932254 RepID=A0ABY4GFV6_9BACT|nr:nuclear transport factor 2 family protein [Hymenobacter volaticus]UOQ69852.1 nuclear transport factor 2 family protein [Hymenobacter volaticus]
MPTSSQALDTRQLVKQYLHALSARDVPALLACFADTVDWNIPGVRELAPWLGPRHTRDEIADFYAQLFEQTEPVTAQLDYLVVDGPVAVVTGSFSTIMTRTNRLFSSHLCLQLVFEADKITHYRLFEDTLALARALEVNPIAREQQ